MDWKFRNKWTSPVPWMVWACLLTPISVGWGQRKENESPTSTKSIDFSSSIRPLLSNRCFACHGPDEEHREADLRLDRFSRLSEDRGGYRILAPGDSENSELFRRISSTDAGEVMPPPGAGKPLTANEQSLLKQWIDEGASWKPHWAYQRPQHVSTPPMTESGENVGGRNWIDAFIARKHSDVGGQFSPMADAVTLIRRLALDLTGLPPTPTDVTVLLKAEDADTALTRDELHKVLDRYADRLLSSPRFGERMAAYWLDLVRFADTVGYHGDQDHNISPYRDYVINAFNDNKPFDQFTIEQLAGDLLPHPSEEQIIATGYNRLLQTSHEGGIQAKEYLAIYQADRVRNLSAVWFGATIGCAQCHDHKYDPYLASDFYSLAAFFGDVDEQQHFKVGSNSLPTKRPPEKPWLSRSQQLELQRKEADLRFLHARPGEPDADQAQQLKELEREVEQVRSNARLCMITVSIPPREVRLLPRGNWLDDSGPIMQPAVPEFLGDLPVDGRANRLDLAMWLTDPQDGIGLLTARVFVNRLWMQLLGQGLSKSVEDFGGQGVPPTHPELLDRLAIEFANSGWDIKHLIRQIVSSDVYRQSSLETDWQRQHDPTNRWLTRQNRFRLPAESIRDSALLAGGLLVNKVGGASVQPYQPAGYYRHLNFPTRKYRASEGADQYRRGVYVHWQRQFLHPMLRAFDAPMREECQAQRTQSNTPLAALVALNDPSFIECARGLARRALQHASHEAGLDLSFPDSDSESDSVSESHGLKFLFRTVTSRAPSANELRTLKRLLQQATAHYEADHSAAEAALSVGLSHNNSGADGSTLAAWTTVARAALNLSESHTRN